MSFHTSDTMMIMGNQVLLPRNIMGSQPRDCKMALMVPSYSNSSRSTPPMTAQERKYGRKNTVCAVRLKPLLSTSLSSRAIISGTSRRRRIFTLEIIRVLRTTVQKVGRDSMA